MREAGSAAVEQRRGRRRWQRLQMQGREPGVGEGALVAVADRCQQQDRLELQPPCHKRQHLAAGTVEPVSILQDNDDRGSRRGFGQQIKPGERCQEKIRSDGIGQAERRQDRAALRCGQPVYLAENWPQKLVQRGEGQLCLALHARGRQNQHPAVLRARAGFPQQR